MSKTSLKGKNEKKSVMERNRTGKVEKYWCNRNSLNETTRRAGTTDPFIPSSSISTKDFPHTVPRSNFEIINPV